MNSEIEKEGKCQERESNATGGNVKKEMIKAVRETNQVKGKVSGMVRKTVSSTLKNKGLEAGEVKQVVKDVVKGGLGAAEEIGIGLAATSRNIARGIITGVHDVGGDTTLAAGYALKYAIREASSIRGDIGQVAIATSDGVIEAVMEVGGNLESAASALIAGAIESASAIGKKYGKKINVSDRLQEHIDQNHQKVRK